MLNKRLFQINVSANAGSTGKIAEQIGISALQAGYESYIAYGKRANSSRSELIRIGSKYNHGIQSRLFDNHGLASKLPTRDLVKRIDDIKPNIIHLHNIHDYYLNYPVLFDYLSSCKTPIIWTLHDCWPFTGHCAHFDFIGCEKWKTHCEKCPGLRTYPKSVWLDRSSKNYDDKRKAFTSIVDRLTIVPVSNWIEGFVRQSFLSCANILTIHNGIDIQIFTPTNDNSLYDKYGIPHNKRLVIGVASPWSERKGLSDFLNVRQKLNEDYVIVLVGLTEKQITELPKGIVGIKRTENQKELAALYSIADVFVNPTYEDNYPTTNLEALACGTPVITYNTGGSPESVTPQTGAVVEKGDVETLCSEIIRLISQDLSINSRACRDWAIRHCDSRAIYKKYIYLYDSLV